VQHGAPFGPQATGSGQLFFGSDDYFDDYHSAPTRSGRQYGQAAGSNQHEYYSQAFNYAAFERSIDSLWPNGGMGSFFIKSFVRHLTKLINSILGKYYHLIT